MRDLKLDTLNKKPKIYNVAILSAVVVLLLTLVFTLGSESLMRGSCLLLFLYCMAVAGLLIRAFFLQMRYNLYSYNTILYFGFALFVLVIGLLFILLYIQLLRVPPETILHNLLGTVLFSPKNYMLITFPFLLVFSIWLVASNISLIRHEGFRLVNLLGVILALLLVGGAVFMFALDYAVSGSMTEVMIHDIVTNFMATVYLYFECMMLGTIVANRIAAKYEPKKDKDFIIVLGCGIRKDGTPTPLLRGRLDRALGFGRQQEAETGKAPVYVLSGGQGPDECISEAECMGRYLAAQGVPAEQLLLENRSTDTAENMAFSKKLIEERSGPQAKVAFSTSDYHVFRSGLKARRVKLRALGMGQRSKWYFWPNASVREFVGLLTQHRGKQGLVLVSMVVFFTVLTVVYYQLLV